MKRYAQTREYPACDSDTSFTMCAVPRFWHPSGVRSMLKLSGVSLTLDPRLLSGTDSPCSGSAPRGVSFNNERQTDLCVLVSMQQNYEIDEKKRLVSPIA